MGKDGGLSEKGVSYVRRGKGENKVIIGMLHKMTLPFIFLHNHTGSHIFISI